MEKSREGSIFDFVQHSSAVQDVAQSLVVVVLFLLSAVWTAEEDDDDTCMSSMFGSPIGNNADATNDFR